MHNARKERAEIMEKQKKAAQKEKRVTATSFNPASAGKAEPIYYSPSNMDGMGLWCQPVSNPSSRKIEKPPIPEPSVFTNDVELKLSKEMSQMLEKKCSELGRLLDQEKYEKKTLEVKIQALEKSLKDSQSEIAEWEEHAKVLQTQKNELENAMDENCIHYNYTENEISSLQKELENEKQRAEMYRKMQEQEIILKEEEGDEYQHEIESLKQTIDGLNDENAGLKEYLGHLQQENEKLIEEREKLGQRYVQEVTLSQTKEEKAKMKATKINLLTTENKALQQKIRELEESRKKNQDFMKKKDDEIKSTKNEIESLKNRIRSEQEMRKHQVDLVAQRDMRLRILEEKHMKLEQQYQKLVKIIPDDEKAEKTPKPKLVKVQANPDLFND
ncbi:hypothetical protein SteCoe_2814 [Stentor coeruleus]|uniref:Uncharacterized protein n=1 Tax=Stentor coeruleus TaxID=5963 RepID=A0A1R2CYF6_9CILI|nr:hypothetical protein SteCoe_2814 [Stentor coeruleus]